MKKKRFLKNKIKKVIFFKKCNFCYLLPFACYLTGFELLHRGYVGRFSVFVAVAILYRARVSRLCQVRIKSDSIRGFSQFYL